MKKLKFFMSICVFAVSSSIAAHAGVTISKWGGGPNGYYSVAENHSGGSHQLFCQQPGYEKCKWMNPPLVVTSGGQYDIDALSAEVEQNIANQNYQGAFTLDQEVEVSWSGQDVYNFSMSVKQL